MAATSYELARRDPKADAQKHGKILWHGYESSVMATTQSSHARCTSVTPASPAFCSSLDKISPHRMCSFDRMRRLGGGGAARPRGIRVCPLSARRLGPSIRVALGYGGAASAQHWHVHSTARTDTQSAASAGRKPPQSGCLPEERPLRRSLRHAM